MIARKSNRRQPLAKEAMAVLTAVDVSVTDHVRFIVRHCLVEHLLDRRSTI